jgi:ureidoacrylate peracid hydrolase
MAMHKIAIPQTVVDRVIARRGKEHVYDDLDPARTALIVVDMQNAFMLPGVAFAPIKAAPEIVPNINRLARAVREAGGTVVWIVTTYTKEVDTEWSTYYGLSTPVHGAKRSAALTKGSKGHQIWPSLEVQADDPIVEKKRFSAFIQGSSALDKVLSEGGIDTLLITGTVTGVCCESTARDAMQRNYQVVFVADGNAAITDAEHNATLGNMIALFADVMKTAEIAALIEADTRLGAA